MHASSQCACSRQLHARSCMCSSPSAAQQPAGVAADACLRACLRVPACWAGRCRWTTARWMCELKQNGCKQAATAAAASFAVMCSLVLMAGAFRPRSHLLLPSPGAPCLLPPLHRCDTQLHGAPRAAQQQQGALQGARYGRTWQHEAAAGRITHGPPPCTACCCRTAATPHTGWLSHWLPFTLAGHTDCHSC